jgi:DNA-binding MarR family transcriptional regulator
LTIIAYANSLHAVTPRDTPPFYDGRNYQPAEAVGYLMLRITAAMRRRVERRLAEHGLTAAQWVPLWLLATGRGDSAQALTCAAGTDAGAMTRLLDRLEAKGLIERERSRADRRVVQLHLTDAGREVVRHIPPVLADVNNEALEGFSAEEFALLQSMLKRIGATLAADEVAA